MRKIEPDDNNKCCESDSCKKCSISYIIEIDKLMVSLIKNEYVCNNSKQRLRALFSELFSHDLNANITGKLTDDELKGLHNSTLIRVPIELVSDIKTIIKFNKKLKTKKGDYDL